MRSKIDPWTLAIVLALAASARAQTLLRELPASEFVGVPGARTRVIGLSDVTLDRHADILVVRSAPNAGGVVKFFSGYQGYNGYTISGTSGPENFADSVTALGDVDGDGFCDFGITAPGDATAFPLGHLWLYTARFGTVFYETIDPALVGRRLFRLGDVNGDHRGDAGLGAEEIVTPNFGSQGALPSDGPFEALGDVDGDGFGDFAAAHVGAANEVWILSGRTLATLQVFSAPADLNVSFGARLANAGDIDHDGKRDLFIGQREYPVTGTDVVGRVYLYSGATGALLGLFEGQIGADDQPGDAFDGAGDVDGDGTLDFVFGFPDATVVLPHDGLVRVVSGRTLGVIFELHGDAAEDHFGQSVAGAGTGASSGVGDVDFDGLDDIVVGSSLGASQAAVFGLDHTGDVLCFGDNTGTPCPCANPSLVGENAGCMNSRGAGSTLIAAGTASISNDTLQLIGAHLPGASSVIFAQGTLDTGTGLPYGDGLLCIDGTITRLGTYAIQLNGVSRMGYDVPGAPLVSTRGHLPVLGGTFVYQARYRNSAVFCAPETFNATNSVRVVWSP